MPIGVKCIKQTTAAVLLIQEYVASLKYQPPEPLLSTSYSRKDHDIDKYSRTSIMMQPSTSSSPTARLLVIGAGARGNGYARHVTQSTKARITCVAEPIASKREEFGRDWIWRDGPRTADQEFASWQDFVVYERKRRAREAAGETNVPAGVDGAFVCTLDDMHCEILEALAPFNLHIMCEKPLATTMLDCLRIRRALKPHVGKSLFSIGHVLRYSPHNVLLRKLVLEDQVIGDVLSLEHTEPVGHWHYSHSYVR